MKILIDIVHPADVNFYKNAVKKLKKKHEIVLTVLDRSKLIDIVKKEYPNLKIIPLGKHRKGKLIKFLGLIDREIKFIVLFIKNHFDRVSSFGYYPAIAAKLFGIKSVLFYDDYEYRLNFNLCKKFGDSFIIPDSIPASGKNIRKYSGFKELAYITNFKPKKETLSHYKLKENQYIFVRDIAPISLNYQNSEYLDFSSIFKELNKKGYEVLYYPENSKQAARYNKLCKVLKSPIKDILSIIYFAKFCISSGDTIARESALLGTPIIYTGNRDMKVNNPLINIGAFIQVTTIDKIRNNMNKVIKIGYKEQLRKKVNINIKNNWENTTKIIMNQIIK